MHTNAHLGSKAKNVLAKEPYCIQIKMYSYVEKWYKMVIFLSNLYTFVYMQYILGPSLKCFISKWSFFYIIYTFLFGYNISGVHL